MKKSDSKLNKETQEEDLKRISGMYCIGTNMVHPLPI